MSSNRFAKLFLLAAVAWPAACHATVFSDNFNTENGGVSLFNYTGLAN